MLKAKGNNYFYECEMAIAGNRNLVRQKWLGNQRNYNLKKTCPAE